MKVCPTCGKEYSGDLSFCPDDGSALRALGGYGDLVGSIVADRYRIIEKLGDGGMGVVYLGEHVKMGRKSAIKVMSKALAEDLDAIARFNREAANASRINHPNVCAIYDFGETADGLVYLAMEFIEGEALTALLDREGGLAPARAANLLEQAAAALQAAHELGIVHRDLKPDNIMIGRARGGGDVVKVVDFGIAKAVGGGSEQRVTRSGLVMGTPDYMSPEQLSGDVVDGRSDTFSLGLVFFRMLTGVLPYQAETSQEVMLKRLTDDPLTLLEALPTGPFPPALQRVIDQALQRMPGDRYASAAQFAADAVEAVGGLPEAVTSEGTSATVSLQVKPVPVDLVVVSPREITLPSEREVQFKAVVIGPEGQVLEGRSVAWAVTDPVVARVSDDGVVEPVGHGTTSVTATAEGQVGTASLTVPPPAVSEIEVVPAAQAIEIGKEIELRAVVRGPHGDPVPDVEMTWSSQDSSVADVDAEGRLQAKAPGVVTVSVAIGSVTASTRVIVEEPGVSTVELHSPSSVLEVGQEVALSVEVREPDGEPVVDRTIDWSLVAPSVRPTRSARAWLPWARGAAALGALASVVALWPRVAATGGGDQGEIGQVPVAAGAVASLSILPGDTVLLQVGEEAALLEALPSGPGGGRLDSVDVRWETTDAEVARVSAAGVVMAVGEGMAEIMASAAGGTPGEGVTASVPVVVPAVQGLEAPVPGPEETSAIARVFVSVERDTLRVGERLPVGATGVTSAGDPVSGREVIWQVSDRAVARVEGTGAQTVVVAVSPGHVRLRATIAGVTESRTLEVVASVTALTLSPAGGDITLGDGVTIRVTDQEGRPQEASFRSSDPSIATVSGSGVLEGQAPGDVTVLVLAAGLSVEGAFTVTAPEPEPAPTRDPVVTDSGAVTPEIDGVGPGLRMPQLVNQREVTRALEQEYPPFLRDANIGGRVLVDLFIDESGRVVNSRVTVSSGHAALDEAALRVAHVFRFTPALRGDQKVSMMISLPIIFRTR